MSVDLMERLRAGVTDLRLTQPARGDADDVDAGPHSTGIFAAIGPFQVDRFVAAVKMIARSFRRFPNLPLVQISPRFVLAQPWRLDRTTRAIAQIDSDDLVDPVQVDRLIVPGLPDMHSVVDGRHRAFATRKAGRYEISANLHAEYFCEPASFFIQGRTLMRDTDGEPYPVSPQQSWGPMVDATIAAVPFDIAYVLQGLGVRMYASLEAPHFEVAIQASDRR